MKKIAILLIVFCVSFSFAQENDKKVKLEKKGDITEATFYYDNGKIDQQGFFKNGKLHGLWTSYDLKGEKIAVGNYNMGEKAGKWIFKTNDVLKEVDYTNDKVENVNSWSRETTVAMKNE
ncbi:nicotinic acid mononucleotide adenyltransferase [Aureibaculum sp. 2210JD6-5]|uniref:toxin-antitoxin system YwqK family antitoxin n=1 Tax=Aureibaculum sp. 2210JD6-5 TaxID=3103957 RepID=UPI002AAE1E30|nr:nicotinic acid mononucleotide adenyltransferase [Aureibaculum sp. 2210JD6-5]MDY7396507.1 nicotinic acid mononucleotide adenyltransferase [Aureibaculum sp. 2210JD6-5]